MFPDYPLNNLYLPSALLDFQFYRHKYYFDIIIGFSLYIELLGDLDLLILDLVFISLHFHSIHWIFYLYIFMILIVDIYIYEIC